MSRPPQVLGRGLELPLFLAVIARSQIVAAQPCRAAPSLPAGFSYADIGVLDWIAAERRRLGRGLLPM
jgi:hypothetical protein